MDATENDQRLLSEQLRVFARNHIGDRFLTPLLVLVVGYGVSLWSSLSYILIWAGCILVSAFFTILIYRKILSHQGLFSLASIHFFHKALYVSRAFFLLSWSSVMLWGWVPGVINNNIFLIMMNCGFIAATAVEGSTLRKLMIIEVMSCSLPALARYLMEGEAFYVSAIMTIFFTVLMIVLALEMHQRFNTAHKLQHDNQDLIERLENLAKIDSLTQINNRRSFFEQIRDKKRYADRYNKKIGLAVIDVDHFKSINDNYGHAVGDEVLKQVAKLLQQAIRDTDVIGRLGGEEFAVLFMDIDQTTLVEMVRRLVDCVSASPIQINDSEIQVTISAGISVYRQNEDIEGLLERADVAMYQAKDGGRNQYSVC